MKTTILIAITIALIGCTTTPTTDEEKSGVSPWAVVTGVLAASALVVALSDSDDDKPSRDNCRTVIEQGGGMSISCP